MPKTNKYDAMLAKICKLRGVFKVDDAMRATGENRFSTYEAIQTGLNAGKIKQLAKRCAVGTTPALYEVVR